MGDSAVLVLRSSDVVGGPGGPPLTGMPTTLAASAGRPLHHPGPSELWLLWPASTSGRPEAVLATVVLSNAVALAVAVGALGRVGGLRAAWVGAALLAALSASVAADTLVDPLNPNFGLLPYAAFLASLLAMVVRPAVGRWWFPLVAVFGTLAAQAHVGLAVLVAGACLAAAVSARGPWRRGTGGVGAPFGVGIAVLAGLWAPVAVDQVAGTGNAWGLVAAGSGVASGEGVAGWDHAARVLAYGLGRPAWAGVGDGLEVVGPQPLARSVVAATSVLVLASVACAGRRLRVGPTAVAAARLLLGSLAVGTLASTRMPTGSFYALAAFHNYLWLWPLAAATAGMGVLGVVHRLRVPTPAVVVGASTAALLAGGLTLAGPAREAVPPWTAAVDHAAPRLLEALAGEARTVRLDVDPDFRRFGIAAALALELEHAGHRVVVEGDLVGSFGAGRDARRSEPVDATLLVVTSAGAAPDGGRRVTSFDDSLGVTSTVWLVDEGSRG